MRLKFILHICSDASFVGEGTTYCKGFLFILANRYIYSREFPSRDQMVILQDSARILQKLPILQDLAEKWLSCKTWQKNGYLARSARKMVILQDSCKFVPVELSSYWLSFMQNISF